MTFVIGMITSKGAYLLADTKVTRKNESGQRSLVCENQRKTHPLNSNIVVAASGNRKMASYIIKEISRDSRVENWNIDTLADDLSKGSPSLIGRILDDYYKTNSFTSVTLTFAGKNPTAKMEVDLDVYKEALSKYQTYLQKQSLVKILYTGNPEMSEVVFQGFINSKVVKFKINAPKYGVFQLIISSNNLPIVKPFPFGRVAMSGSYSDATLGATEYALGVEFHTESEMMGNAQKLVAIIASDFGETIGGCITPVLINDLGIFDQAQRCDRASIDSPDTKENVFETVRVDGNIHMKKDGKTIPLLPLTQGDIDGSFEL